LKHNPASGRALVEEEQKEQRKEKGCSGDKRHRPNGSATESAYQKVALRKSLERVLLYCGGKKKDA